MMEILIDIYKQTSGRLHIPESVRQRGIMYVTFSHWALRWFDENYIRVPVDVAEVTDYVGIGDLFNTLKLTDIYKTLTYTEKRTFTKMNLISLFSCF